MRNGKGHSFKTDVWSAGCVLYELITLKRYFDQNKSNDDSFDNLNTKNVFKLLLSK